MEATVDALYRWINPVAGAKKLIQCLLVDPNPTVAAMNCVQRYRDNGELRFSLRSICRYAPWIRRIHILGEGDPPEWLRVGGKISWVDSVALMKRHGQEPQPNSETQKLFIAAVPGLSEKFMIFDDDWFLGDVTSERDFYADGDVPIHPESLYLHGSHAPTAWTKTLFEIGLRRLPPDFVDSIRSLGVSRTDPVREIRVLLREAGLVVTSSHRDAQAWLRDTNVGDFRSVLRTILETRPQTYCLNDDWSADPSEYCRQMTVLQSFFEEMYPEPAPWELPDQEQA
jgi:hypothetical protein